MINGLPEFLKNVRATFLFTILTLTAVLLQAQEQYAGKLLYVTVDESSYSIDSIVIYYSANRIQLINQPGEETRSVPFRRIADLQNRKQYWIIDRHKLILEEPLPLQSSKLIFEELPGTQMVQNVPARGYISELKFEVPKGEGLEEFNQKLLVAGAGERTVINENLFLPDYGFYKGRIIIKKDLDAWFAENKNRGRKSTFTLMENLKNVDGPSSELPAGYRRKPFSLHEFFTAFERPAIHDLIRFYLDGSLKN